jgi:pimeloyl-ACP methyl ester carboxylesterase
MKTNMHVIEKFISINEKNIWTKKVDLETNLDNPTIVFLHDALGSIAQWKNFPLLLAQETNLNILMYDRVGHGLSDKREKMIDINFFEEEAFDYLPEVLKVFGIKNPILFGHSDGGTIALLYASKYPTRALILEAAHVFYENITRLGVVKTGEIAHDIIQGLQKYHGDKAEKLFNNWYNLWSGNKIKDWSIEHDLKNIKAPTMIIQGDNDNYGSKMQITKIVENINTITETFLLNDCGHIPHIRKGQEVLERICKFLHIILHGFHCKYH